MKKILCFFIMAILLSSTNQAQQSQSLEKEILWDLYQHHTIYLSDGEALKLINNIGTTLQKPYTTNQYDVLESTFPIPRKTFFERITYRNYSVQRDKEGIPRWNINNTQGTPYITDYDRHICFGMVFVLGVMLFLGFVITGRRVIDLGELSFKSLSTTLEIFFWVFVIGIVVNTLIFMTFDQIKVPYLNILGICFLYGLSGIFLAIGILSFNKKLRRSAITT